MLINIPRFSEEMVVVRTIVSRRCWV